MMIRSITRNVIVPVLPDLAWEYVGDFDALASWHPGVPPVEMENNADPKEIGSVRTFSVDGRVVAREQLRARDAEGRSYSYEVLDPMLPVRDYIATIAVVPHDQGSELQWSATYRSGDDAVAMIEQAYGDNVYGTGLKAFGEHFGA